MNKFVIRQSLLLLLTATIWGVAFVAQSVGMDYIGPFTFNAVRNVIGGVVLLPCIALLHRTGAKEEGTAPASGSRKNLLLGGICCGVLLFVASNLQQIGIQYTTVGKAGFITAMYIVLVPILSIFLGKKAGMKIWAAVCGVIHFMHDGRQLFPAKRRSACSVVGICIFRAYFGHRPFCPAGGRGKDVVHSVFRVCAAVGGLYVAV